MQQLPHSRSCYVCGESNPLGLQLRFETDGRIVHARFTPRAEHNGFKGIVHGGIIATALDEILSWVCAIHAQRFAFCAELNVRYLNPMPTGGEVHLRAELVADRKGRLFEARAAAQDGGGKIFAEATGKYIPLKNVNVAELESDLIGTLPWAQSAKPGA